MKGYINIVFELILSHQGEQSDTHTFFHGLLVEGKWYAYHFNQYKLKTNTKLP